VDKEKISSISLLFVAAVWGFNFVAVKFLLAEISPINLVLFRFFTGSILLFLLLFFYQDVKIPFKDFLHLCGLGIIGITAYQLAFVYALKYTSVTNVSILINASPLYGGVLSSSFGFERFNKKRFIATMTGFIGVFILITKGGFRLAGGDTKGNLLAVAASVLWALYTLLSKPLLNKHSPLKVTTYSMIGGSALLCFFIPSFLDVHEYAEMSLAGWVFFVYAVIFSNVIAFILWYRGVSRIGPSKTIIYQYSVPVFATLFAFLSLGEKLHFSQLVGAVIVFASIALTRKY